MAVETEAVFVCRRADYMGYGFISNKSLCAQPPQSCPFEVNETIKLQTGVKRTIYYCIKRKKPERPKTATAVKVAAETQALNACSLSGR